MTPPLAEWLALQRVHEGGVTKVAGVYLDHDAPIPAELVAVFDELAWTGWLTLAEGDPLWASRGVGLSDTGRARYEVLRERHGAGPGVPDPVFGAVQAPTEAPAGRRCSAPGGQSGTT